MTAPDPAETSSRCAICGTRIRDEDAVSTCADCEHDYHEACWNEIGGCATYGCKQAAVAEKAPPRRTVGAGWGDEKECPACETTIASSLLVCPCGARFPWADPMEPREYRQWLAREGKIASARSVLVALFVATLAGFPAPICGPLAGLYAFRRRSELAGRDGVYLAIGYGSAALGAAYLVTVVVLASL